MTVGAADDVADRLWQRVRELSAQIAQLEHAAAESPHPAAHARLDHLRVAAARAVSRAELADDLAEQLNQISKSA